MRIRFWPGIAIAFLLLNLSAPPAFADDQEVLNAEFRQLLVTKTLTLRNFDSHSWQKYQEDGHFEGEPSIGPWTLYSKLSIRSVNVGKDSITLIGSRVFVRFDNNKRDLQLLGSREPLRIDIKVGKPLSSATINSALAKVLVHSGESMAPLVPSYWRNYFEP